MTEAFHDQVAKFMSTYYDSFNKDPMLVHQLYGKDSMLSWPTMSGDYITVATSDGIKKSLRNCWISHMKVLEFRVQQSLKGVLLVVKGTSVLNKLDSQFVQSFFLNEKSPGEFVILNDILLINEDPKVAHKGKSIVAESSKVNTAGRTNPNPVEHKKKSSVVVLYDERMLGHVEVPVPGYDPCPEVPERLEYIIKQFKTDGLFVRCEFQDSNMASYDQLQLLHDPGYVQFISKLPVKSESEEETYVGNSIYFSEDEGTRTACLVAAGCLIKACDLIAQNEFKRAFAVVRPPGHHALKNKADGFCFLNNIAIGADHLLKNCLIKKVLVLDFDVHHGNGTQAFFYNSNEVLFITIQSTQFPYPMKSDRGISFVGEGDGEGFNINISLRGRYGDGDLIYVWNQIVLPIAKEFSPDITMISAGYDAAKDDSMSICEVTEKGYGTVIAKTCTVGTGRVIMGLEGGYNLQVTATCASHSVRALLDDPEVLLDERTVAPLHSTKETVAAVKSVHCKYWEVLKVSCTETDPKVARKGKSMGKSSKVGKSMGKSSKVKKAGTNVGKIKEARASKDNTVASSNFLWTHYLICPSFDICLYPRSNMSNHDDILRTVSSMSFAEYV